MDIFKKCTDFTQADEIKAMGVYPYFHQLETKQDTEVEMEGQSLIMIGSNNYLGLTCNQEVIEAGINALKQFGSGCSGSRFLNGTLTLHTQFENELANFVGKEACVTFGTGFQTNLGIISTIAGRGDWILMDKENHASLYDGCKLSYAEMKRYKHSDMADLESLLIKGKSEEKGMIIVTDGVFSMSGDICLLPEICALAEKYGARVMVDDAHGFGILGNHGRGTADYFGLTDKVDIIMGTFSKSLAAMGGFCAASERVVNFIRHNSRPYIFCASIPPANVACAIKSLEIMKRDDSRTKNLLEISRYVREGLMKRGLKIKNEEGITPIVPIYTYTTMNTFIACEKLFKKGVYVNPVIAPAAPEGQCLIRTSYMATHTKEQLDRAMDTIAQVLNEMGIN